MRISGRHLTPPNLTPCIESLAQWCPLAVAQNFSQLSKLTDGVEIRVDSNDDYDCLVIDELDCILDPENRAASSEVFSELFVIGSDGGEQVVGYDLFRAPKYPIVMHCPEFHGSGKAPALAADMSEFIRRFVTSPD